jgi:hypothetical protein
LKSSVEKKKIQHYFKRKQKKESLMSRQAGRDVKFFYKNTTRGTRVEIFIKTRRA